MVYSLGMARIITIPDREDEGISAFQARHEELHKAAQTTAIGGRYTLEITGTSIGSIFVIRCVCGAKEDVTAYDEW